MKSIWTSYIYYFWLSSQLLESKIICDVDQDNPPADDTGHLFLAVQLLLVQGRRLFLSFSASWRHCYSQWQVIYWTNIDEVLLC